MTLSLSCPDDAFPHLHPDVRHLALAPLRVRKQAIYTERWLDYPAATDAIDRMFELLHVPPRTRMPSILFWAAPNMGKTSILRRFEDLFKVEHESLGLQSDQVLPYELSGKLDEQRLFIELLQLMNAPESEQASPARLQRAILASLKVRDLRILLLDEFQKVARLRQRQELEVVDALRLLSSQANLCLVAFGSREAKGVIEADPHLRERFEVIELPKWDRREKWAVDLVRQRVALMPLRNATVVDREFMDALKANSQESIGRLFILLERCAIASLEKEECITPAVIAAVTSGQRRVR